MTTSNANNTNSTPTPTPAPKSTPNVADETPTTDPSTTPETDPTTDPNAEAEPTTTDEDTDTEPTTDPQLRKARTEAARYRTQLRETETQRDELTQRVQTLQRRLVEQAFPQDANLKPEALWAATPTATPADFIDDDGNINTQALAEATNNAREKLGITRFSGSADGGARRGSEPSGATSWADLLRQGAP